MSQSSDATAAYRGYRLQALYALFRILEQDGNNDLIFQPEKLEDLSIQDGKGDLREVIQVKSGYLKLSSFKESFFSRIYPLVKSQNPPQIIIASFGKVGPELRQAIEQDGPERKDVSKKIKDICVDFIHSDEEARIILENLKLNFYDELELTEKVYSHLRNILTGIDPDSAFDLLNFWLYICSEKKYEITKADVIKKIGNIGKFLAERDAYHEEWFRSIKPIDDYQINSEELGKLNKEFYQGISARYEHILADADILRSQKIEEIKAKFEEDRVIIIHGASGQGKTTLAYRYLHDCFPNMWRFKVELIEDRRHALNIARAIMGHADAIDILVAVYLDVSSKDSDWPDLIKQLSVHRNIRILVTVREEDYNRASIQNFEIQFKDVNLTFDKYEAQEIYQSLEKAKVPPQFLSFDEAWDRFGGQGPLMEFIYLVTQGESLRKRLRGQVTRLRDEARQKKIEPGEIELLTLVSVASAFDAQLKVKPLICSLKDSLKLASPQRTFELFEKEYLLRLSPDGSLVRGLHPIRSEILASLLTDPTISPWSECARNCLPLIYEADIESFLLYSFLRCRKDTESLIVALDSWQPDRWLAIGGITRAMIWLGIMEYVDRNKELIQDTFEDAGSGFTVLLDSDVSDAIPGLASSTLNSLCSLNPTEEFRQRIVSYRSRQTDKSQVYTRAKTWLSNRTVSPVKPLCNEDWSGMAEVYFWLGRFGIRWPFFDQIPSLELEKAIEDLPLEIFADLIFGLNYGYGRDFAVWITSNNYRIINRFREETLTVNFQDKEKEVDAHFLIEFEKLTDLKLKNGPVDKSSNYPHDEAMRRIKLLRRIRPDRDTYACHGYGHRIGSSEIQFDDTHKVIPISSLPSKWLTLVNSTFRGLAEKPQRPNAWNEYAEIIFKLRKQTLDVAKQIESGLKAYFQKPKPDQLFGKLIDVKQWNQHQQMLSKWPLIPLCAVDEWGFVDEFADSPTDKPGIIRGLTLQKHKPFLTCFEEYKQHLRNFLNQSVHAMVLNPIQGKCGGDELGKRKSEQKMIENGVKPNFVRLSENSLTEFITILPTFQRKFRLTFSQFIEMSDLDDLERQERITFHNLWCMWYFFIYNSNLTSSNPKKECIKKIDRMTNNIRKTIEEDLATISSENIRLSACDTFWEDKPALLISIDGNYGLEVMISANRIFPEIFKSINSFIETELAKLIFKTKWPLIILVTKIQGKCLTDIAWIVNSYNFLLRTNEDISNLWNFATPKKIPRDILTELNIKVWDLLQLEVATRFARNIEKLSLHLAIIKDIKRLPLLDDQGIVQFKIYAKKLMEYIKLETQIVLTSAEEMKNFIEKSSFSDYHIYPNMSEIENALTEVIKYITSLSNSLHGIELELKTVVEWANKLDEWKICVIYASNAYLFWVSYVINRSV